MKHFLRLNNFTEEEIEEKEKKLCAHENLTEYPSIGRACHDCKQFLFKKEDIAIAKGECLHKNFDTVPYPDDDHPNRKIHHCLDCGDTFEI